MKLIDLTGWRFGRLLVLRRTPPAKNKTLWLCRCDCGEMSAVFASNLKRGLTRSCGCLNKEVLARRSEIHGHTGDYKVSRTYRSWQSMLKRCADKKDVNYRNYGGRGIKVCKRWLKFENFLGDMGERPLGTTLDRRDNGKGYTKHNCRWATRLEQANNKRNNVFATYKGKTQTITQWARELHINVGTLYWRLKDGWSIEKTLETPVRKS